MFFLVIKRLVRRRDEWEVGGPFNKATTAEKAALAALKTYTCLNTQILASEQIEVMLANQSTSGHYIDHALDTQLRLMRKLHFPPQPAAV